MALVSLGGQPMWCPARTQQASAAGMCSGPAPAGAHRHPAPDDDHGPRSEDDVSRPLPGSPTRPPRPMRRIHPRGGPRPRFCRGPGHRLDRAGPRQALPKPAMIRTEPTGRSPPTPRGPCLGPRSRPLQPRPRSDRDGRSTAPAQPTVAPSWPPPPGSGCQCSRPPTRPSAAGPVPVLHTPKPLEVGVPSAHVPSHLHIPSDQVNLKHTPLVYQINQSQNAGYTYPGPLWGTRCRPPPYRPRR